MNTTINETDLALPGQTGFYRGKVREVYTIDDNLLVMIASDRISAFDVVLPQQIPYKGQVLNQIADFMLDKTRDICPNWKMEMPDPNAMIGYKCEPYKVEMVIRRFLTGSMWKDYKAGKREICGIVLPNGMREFDMFQAPLVTPTTKASEGHDENISPKQIINQGLMTLEEYRMIENYTKQLFARGEFLASERKLTLVDTKYEFGKRKDGTIMLIDEIHTPDSSRYWYENYRAQIMENGVPKQLSKEFVREWLTKNNFTGKEEQTIPNMSEIFIGEVTEKYIELYETITGQKFQKAEYTDVEMRIEHAVKQSLLEL